MNKHMALFDGCHVTAKSKAFETFDEPLTEIGGKSICVYSFLVKSG